MESVGARIEKAIKEFLNSIEGIGGIYVASLDGLLINYASRVDVDPDRVAAMIASISAVGDRVSKELLNEDSMHVIVQAHTGYIVIKRQGDYVFGVLVQGSDDSSIGLTMLELDRLLNTIRNIK